MFDPTVHEVSAPLRGDAAAALDVARIALLSLGFEIVSETDVELFARGPGMQSNREPALLGASELRLEVTSSKVAAQATLGGVATMKAFVFLFPPGLALSLALVFAFFGMGKWRVALAWAAPWLLISPWMASRNSRRLRSPRRGWSPPRLGSRGCFSQGIRDPLGELIRCLDQT